METIHFKRVNNDLQFLKVLRQKVDTYFESHRQSKTANAKAWIKASLLFILYSLFTVLIFFSQSLTQLYLNYAVLGMLTIFLALNIAHDAAHGTFSKSMKINAFLLNTFDLLGASGFVWKNKHVHSHHPYVNIPNVDQELKQSVIVRIFPNSKFIWHHRYQVYYMPFVYLFYTSFWLCFRDFKDFFYGGYQEKYGQKQYKKEALKFFFGKFLFFTRMLILPLLILKFSIGELLLGFLIFHFSASYTVAVALVSTHVGEHSSYPAPDQKGSMPFSWVRHQLITTCDFATKSTIISQLFGSFNHHVIHHLFPNICHIHYPKITQLLIETCAEFKMPYYSKKSLLGALRSHGKFLKLRSLQLAKVPDLEM